MMGFMEHFIQGYSFGLGVGLSSFFISWAISSVIKHIKAVSR